MVLKFKAPRTLNKVFTKVKSTFHLPNLRKPNLCKVREKRGYSNKYLRMAIFSTINGVIHIPIVNSIVDEYIDLFGIQKLSPRFFLTAQIVDCEFFIFKSRLDEGPREFLGRVEPKTLAYVFLCDCVLAADHFNL